jgi:hypothetical protein
LLVSIYGEKIIVGLPMTYQVSETVGDRIKCTRVKEESTGNPEAPAVVRSGAAYGDGCSHADVSDPLMNPHSRWIWIVRAPKI